MVVHVRIYMNINLGYFDDEAQSVICRGETDTVDYWLLAFVLSICHLPWSWDHLSFHCSPQMFVNIDSNKRLAFTSPSCGGCFHLLSIYCTLTPCLALSPYSARRLTLRVRSSFAAQDLESAEKKSTWKLLSNFPPLHWIRWNMLFLQNAALQKAFPLAYSFFLSFFFFLAEKRASQLYSVCPNEDSL